MLPAHEEILSIQLVTNNKYARQVRSCAAASLGIQILIIYVISIYRVYKKKRNLGISQEIDIVLKTKDFRGLGI
jgi:hypothetical protein